MRNSDEIIDKCATSTLSEVVDEYLITRGVDKKKHFGKYLVISQRIWQDIFWNTLWVVKTQWMTLKKGDPYDYIDTPRGMVRLFSVNTTDHCGKLVPLFYNNQLNVVARPTVRNCGCNKCNCAGICEDVNGFQVTTKVLFTINGISYSEKTWLKYCPNGDIWEYSQIPTKKYLDFSGDGGDYSNDYNNDYFTGLPPAPNYEIVTHTTQKKLCALTVKPCGCPEESPVNQQLLLDNCGCFLPFFSNNRHCYCDRFLDDPAPNLYGSVKLSECGTKIYYKPPIVRKDCIVGPGPIPRLPNFLQVSFQGDAKSVDAQTLVPDFALLAMWTGMDWRSKLFNSKYPYSEKKGMEYQYNAACNDMILFLNTFNMETLSYIQDIPTIW